MWWADTNQIARYQSILDKNGQKHSERLSRMYLKRRLRHAVSAMVRNMMEKLHRSAVSTIDLGNLDCILQNNNT